MLVNFMGIQQYYINNKRLFITITYFIQILKLHTIEIKCKMLNKVFFKLTNTQYFIT